MTPSPQSPVFDPSPQASLIPAPRDLRVASGQGKILMYELTADGKRVPMKQEHPQGPQAVPAPFKEIRRQLSWVVITGVVDHKTIAENLARAGIGETALETSRHPAGMIGMMRKNIPRSEIARPAAPGMVLPRHRPGEAGTQTGRLMVGVELRESRDQSRDS